MNGSTNLRLHLLYVPPPDGEDASATYALRASSILANGSTTVQMGHVGRLTPDGGPLWEGQSTGASDASTLFVFLVSCSADGSVDRSVRKVMQKLPQAASATHEEGTCRYAVALLGHARCDNSAKQMGDTIFGTGRRFEKALAGSSIFETLPCVPRLETQAELCGPEDEFDPWVMSLVPKNS